MNDRKIVEWTLVSLDGVFSGESTARFMDYADDPYYRNGLGLLLGCDAALLGRTTYQSFAALWPGRDHPWAGAINAMPKYVFSSTLTQVDWSNSTVLPGDPVAEIRKIKQQPGRDLLVWGHGQLARTLLEEGLVDVLEVAVHPFLAGKGQVLFHEGLSTTMRLMASQTFAGGIVKLTYEPRRA